MSVSFIPMMILIACGLIKPTQAVVKVTRTTFVMGSECEISVEGTSRAAANLFITQQFKYLADCDQKWSVFKPKSLISEINKNAYLKAISIDTDTYELLLYAQRLHTETDSLFDITIYPLLNLWGLNKKIKKAPSQQEIDSVRLSIGMKQIQLTEKTIRLLHPNTQIDFGGIAVGYVLEKIKTASEKNPTILSLKINFSGDIIYLNKHQPNETFDIALIHPETKQIVQTIKLQSGFALTTSGIYEQFKIYHQEKYGHIINPKTGVPEKRNRSITVISSNAIWADAWATVGVMSFPDTASVQVVEIEVNQ